MFIFFFFSSRRRHTRCSRDWSSDVCSSDLPLVPTINSAVALWAFGHLYKNDQLVTDNAMVHVMLLSRTRRDGDFALACWNCSKNKIEELQLQILPGPGEPKLAAPGGFLFLNWEKSSSRKAS